MNGAPYSVSGLQTLHPYLCSLRGLLKQIIRELSSRNGEEAQGASHSTALFVTGSRNGYPRNELLISRSSSTSFLLASVGRNHWRDCPMTSLPAVPKQRCCHFFGYKAGHFTEFVQSVYVPNSNTLDLVLGVGVGGRDLNLRPFVSS